MAQRKQYIPKKHEVSKNVQSVHDKEGKKVGEETVDKIVEEDEIESHTEGFDGES